MQHHIFQRTSCTRSQHTSLIQPPLPALLHPASSGVISSRNPAFLDGLRRQHRDHGFTPSLLLGFFLQDKKRSSPDLWKHHIDKTRCLAPSFVPISELSQFVGSKSARNAIEPLSLETFIPGLGASLNFHRPFASHSQDNILVLCRQSEVDNGQDTKAVLCVCNPLTGETFEIPRHIYYVPPNHYVLFVTNDVDSYAIFWLRKAKCFVSVCYSSKTGTWTRTEEEPELMPGLYLVSSSAAASGDVIHWLCGTLEQMSLTHVATLHIENMGLSYLELPPEAKHIKIPVLANSADGGILLLFMQGLEMSLWKHINVLGSDSNSWVLSERIDMRSSLPQRVATLGSQAKVRLEMFGGKSGVVVLRVVGEGLFLFSLSVMSRRGRLTVRV
ncbi:hypothetical protein CFC21_068538 [Triticum aestivum]|uniref:DUF7595 domain-containing protein n=2 Tax=Triticum aestivum TaxID=4565 RepID=A0A3B6KQH4_WHEAT|nr:uncharacterized protein LOC123108194 [Triticum aestivum]KAF7061883.1 hypothetical protein CFC21_068538 [Triticum aestivum]